MSFKISKKTDPKTLLRLLLYYLAGCAGIILSQTLSSDLTLYLTGLLSVCSMTLLFASIGITAALPALLPLGFIGFTEGIDAVLAVAVNLLLSAALGLSVKNKQRPLDTVIAGTGVYIASGVLFTVLSAIISTGSFSITEFFKSVSSTIDELFSAAAQSYKSVTGTEAANIAPISEMAKSIIVGGYIAMQMSAVCIYYTLTLVLARITKDTAVYNGHVMFDLKPSVITAWIYVICIVFSPISYSDASSIRFYTHLPTNLAIILTPVFVFAGIYYLVNIKFKVEHGSPAFLIIAFAVSLFGMIQVLPIYIAFCGVIYTLKYKTPQKEIPNNE